MKNTFIIAALIFTLVSCGDSATDSQNTEVNFGSSGSTAFSGEWTLKANISVQAGSTLTAITEESRVLVNNLGAVGISTTDSKCSLRINFNGATISYQTTCLVNNSIKNAAPCTILFTGFATITGNTSKASASGSFDPGTLACNGAAVNFTGSISGEKV